MTTLREAAQQALEAIDRALPHAPHHSVFDVLADCADDLRAALSTCKEGLQVEPVAWRYKGEPWFDGNRWHDKCEVTTDERVAKFKDKDATPLYTAPRMGLEAAMTDLRTAAQQALEEWRTEPGSVRMASLMMALEAALAEHFCDTHCTWADHAPGCVRAEPVQDKLTVADLRDAMWLDPECADKGACQSLKFKRPSEPVQEPVAWLAPDGSVRKTPAAKSFREWAWGPNDFTPLYTAPPQRKPLTEEEIRRIYDTHKASVPLYHAIARAIERAHGIE